MLEEALLYADLGFSVIPMHYTRPDGKCSCLSPTCGSIGKHPRVRWKDFTRRRLTPAEIKRFWEADPSSNIGIVTGEISGVAVLDVDGEEGVQSLKEVGLEIGDLPLTPTVRTGGGGWHFYFRYPESHTVLTKAGVLSHVDVRSDGGVVVAPPSVHNSGIPYTWVEGKGIQSLDPADFDFSLLSPQATTREARPEEADAWYTEALSGAGEGGRNDLAAKLAGRYFSLGMQYQEVLQVIRIWNLANNPPMEDAEVQKVVSSIRRKVESGQPTFNKAELLEDLSRLIGVPLKGVRRVTGDSPKILLEFDRGLCLLTTAQLISPGKFQEAVCSATKQVIRKRSTKSSPSHERLAQMILDASDDVDAGTEATNEGELSLLLRDYLSSQSMFPSGDELPEQGPFRRDEKLWISLVDLVQVANVKWGARTSVKDMAQRLRAAGFERRAFSQGVIQRNMWGIDPELLGIAVKEGEDAGVD